MIPIRSLTQHEGNLLTADNTIKKSRNEALKSTQVQIRTAETHKFGYSTDLLASVSLHREYLMHYHSYRSRTV